MNSAKICNTRGKQELKVFEQKPNQINVPYKQICQVYLEGVLLLIITLFDLGLCQKCKLVANGCKASSIVHKLTCVIQNLTKQLGRRICRKRFCQLFKQEFVRVLKRNRVIYCKQQQKLFLTYVTDIHAFNQQTQRL